MRQQNGSITRIKINERKIMNKYQVEGEVKDLAGKVQERVGKLIGSKELQAKGLQKQVIRNAVHQH